MVQFVVPLMERNTVIVDYSGNIDLTRYIAVALVLIQLETICFHRIALTFFFDRVPDSQCIA